LEQAVTALDVVAQAVGDAAQVGNCHGFVANRMMANYGVEARNVLMSGTIRSVGPCYVRLAPRLTKLAVATFFPGTALAPVT
jgi:hypothetical protein